MLVLTIVKESKLLWGVLMNRHLNYIAKSFPSFIKQTIGLTASKLINSLHAIFGCTEKMIFEWLLRYYNIIVHVVILNLKIYIYILYIYDFVKEQI